MNVSAKLKEFGFDSKWLESEVFSMGFFHEQAKDQNQSGHQSYEHYRYGMFRHWLSSREGAKDGGILDYIELALGDPDKEMGCSALIGLLEVNWLTDEQFDLVVGKVSPAYDCLSREIEQTTLSRRLKNNELDGELFCLCLAKGSALVHNELLNHPGISREQMGQLAENGCNRKIRNMASQNFKSNKRWNV